MLFTHHNIQYHLVGGLHTFGTDAAEVADGLLNAVFNDTVIGRDTDVIQSKNCRLH